MRAVPVAVLTALLASVAPVHAEPWQVDATFGLAHFQQQAKQAVGTERGDRLVEFTGVTVGVHGALAVHPNLMVLAFGELDAGTRRAGDLAGFDADGRAITDPAVGGRSFETWVGLGVRARYRAAFLELGYPLFARRWDTARDDLPATGGGTDGAFAPQLSVRWMAAVGAGLPITARLRATARLEWRIRYYDERGGQALAGDVVHGTQELRPLFGLAWTP